jgi:hypothetical protein
VNAYKTTKEFTFTLNTLGKKVSYYNAVTGSISVINAEYSTNKTTFTFKLPANTTGFFLLEK